MVLCFIPGKNGSLTLYDDDGISSDYKKNNCSQTRIEKHTDSENRCEILIHAVEGSFQGMKKTLSYELIFPAVFPPAKVMVDDVEYAYLQDAGAVGWSYKAEDLSLHIHIPSCNRSQELKVCIFPKSEYKEKDSVLYGKKGMMMRSDFCMNALKYALNTVDPFANLSPEISYLGSLKTRITYQTEDVGRILMDFDLKLDTIKNSIRSYSQITESERKSILKQFYQEIELLEPAVIRLSDSVSDQSIVVSMRHKDADVRIYYTLDGSLPDEKSNLYTSPFSLGKTCTIRARCYKGENAQSKCSSVSFKRIYAKNIGFEKPYSEKYDGGGKLALADGVLGNAKDYQQFWTGFEEQDMVCTIELKNSMDLKYISCRFLENQRSWIFSPVHLKYEVSTDGIQFRNVFENEVGQKAAEEHRGENILTFEAHVLEKNVKYVRITAQNLKVCPDWHYGRGGKCWIFVDEVVVE